MQKKCLKCLYSCKQKANLKLKECKVERLIKKVKQ